MSKRDDFEPVEQTPKPVLLEFIDEILILTLNRPEKLNALNQEVISGLKEGLAEATAPEVRALVILGSGRAFSSGADVAQLSSKTQEERSRFRRFLEDLAETILRIDELDKPVIAGVQGHAVGGGAEIALQADMRVLSTDATLSFPDVAIGSSPATVHSLVGLVGRGLASSVVLAGENLDAQTLEKMGVASQVVSAERVREASLELAGALRDRASAESLRFAKGALAAAQTKSLSAELAQNVDAMMACAGSTKSSEHVERIVRR